MDESIYPYRFDEMPVEDLCIRTIRTLAMDAVQQANSGHPGTPMALAPAAYVLWTRFLRFNPHNPAWFNRDRFILSNGHASMLQYALLYLTGYDLSLEEIKAFRQWQSRTPGHPEYGVTPGIEVTTGPLGQGIMDAVGMAMAEAHLAAIYNRRGHEIIDHYTYVFASDGDLMEGASHEAASVAGHLGLGKLIVLYDDNHISIDGNTAITFSDDVAQRFEGYHWHVQNLGECANDLACLTEAFTAAQQEYEHPSLIILRSHIADGAPHAHDTAAAHGSPLGEEEVRATKSAMDWPVEKQFLVPERALKHMRQAVENGLVVEHEWRKAFENYQREYPELAEQLALSLNGGLPAKWDEAPPSFAPDAGPMATRSSAAQVLNHFAAKIPWLLGGAADLAASTKTVIKEGGDFAKGLYGGRNIHWGVREHVMCAASTGLARHGGVRPFASTFFIFTDYARPAIRLAALMGAPVIYVLSHDSIGLGEDGPTHQPIEHLASFRAMPNLCLIRPADANESVYAWQAALARMKGPTMLIVTRQKLPILDRSSLASAEGVLKGAYVLKKEEGASPDLILIASGSEVHLTLEAQALLRSDHGIDARVVSMPSWELFAAQKQGYQSEVLPPQVKARLAVEAGASFGWCQWVGDAGAVIGIDRFGASAPGKENFAHHGFTVENIVSQARKLVGSS
jgi:transketolase